MQKCKMCGRELLRPEDFAQGSLEKNLCAYCNKPRVSQKRKMPWQDTTLHQKFGQNKPPSEPVVHLARREMLRRQGFSEIEIKNLIEKWHKDRSID